MRAAIQWALPSPFKYTICRLVFLFSLGHSVRVLISPPAFPAKAGIQEVK